MAVKARQRGGKGKPLLSQEDQTLWAQVTGTVRPLAGRTSTSMPEGGDSQAALPAEVDAEDMLDQEVAPRMRVRPRLPSQATARPRSGPPLSHGEAPGLDRRTKERLRRGAVALDGRIDLHGHTRVDAERALTAFLEASVAAGRRAVLVITGRGLRQDGRVGVLRSAVPEWLNGPRLRPLVKAFSYATPQDGGEGALYVLLRRKERISGGGKGAGR